MPGTSLTELSSPFSGEKRRSSTPSGSRWRNSFCQVRGVGGSVRGCSGRHLRSGAPRDMHVLTALCYLLTSRSERPMALSPSKSNMSNASFSFCSYGASGAKTESASAKSCDAQGAAAD